MRFTKHAIRLYFPFMSMSTTHQPAGWYPDPAGGAGLRWWDGQGWTGQRSFAKPRKPLGKPFAVLSDWLARLLLVNAGVAVIAMMLEVWGYTKMQTFLSDPAHGNMQSLEDYDSFSSVLNLLTFGLTVFTAIVWIIWQRRLVGSAPAQLRRGKGMHTASWVIPFGNYWMPFQNMSDLWRAYQPQGRQGGPQQGPPPISMLAPWWTCWVVCSMVSGLSFRVFWSAQTLEQYQQAAAFGAFEAFLTAIAAVLACLVVRRMGWRALVFHADAR